YVDASDVPHVAVLHDGTRVDVAPAPITAELEPVDEPAVAPFAPGATAPAPLGRVAGARSGDKGGDANLGVWVRDDAQFPWPAATLTVARLRELLPEPAELPVERHVFPNLRAVNFVIGGLLGAGVAFNARHDPQAKALGEWLRSRVVDVPVGFLP